MDSRILKQTVPVLKTVLNSCEECVISNDFVLPDYCPDIAVVLKCIVTPYIHSRQWSSGQLLLDGTALIRVLYLDEERRCIRKAEFSQPLSLSLRRDEGMADPMVRIVVRQDYMNCRATSPRRLEVRGAFTVCVEAQCGDHMDVLAPDCEGVHIRHRMLEASSPKTFTERVVALNDVLDLSSALPTEDRLLYSNSHVCINECKLLTGKAIVKGMVYVRYRYGDESNGSVCPVEHTIPFSQILDLDGAEDGDRCVAYASVLSDTQRIVPNGEGQNATLEMFVKLLVQVQVYTCQTVQVVTDAYHCRYPSVLKTTEMTVNGFVGVHRYTTTLQPSLELPAGDLHDILDVWLQPLSTTCECKESKAYIRHKVNVCMLVRDINGLVAYFERPEELLVEQPVDADTVHADVEVIGLTANATDTRLDMRVELHISLSLWSSQMQDTVQDVTLHTEDPYPDDRAAVRLYYAKAGEKVWNIARECHTSPDSVRQENGLREDELRDDAVLVIPLC